MDKEWHFFLTVFPLFLLPLLQVAEEAGASFISIDGPELFAPYLGESEENLRRVFGDAQLRATTGSSVSNFLDQLLVTTRRNNHACP